MNFHRVSVAIALFLVQPATLLADEYENERIKAEALYSEGNLKEFSQRIEALSEKGDAASQNLYGNFLWRNGNQKEAERWLLAAAKTGNAKYQLDIGNFYLAKSPNRNNKNAIYWIGLSAEQGNSKAKYILGMVMSPPKSPVAHNGRFNTVDLADSSYAATKSFISSSEEMLACYKTDKQGFDSVFSPNAAKCKDRALQDNGKFIKATPEDGLAFSRSYSACLRNLVLEAQGISEMQLLNCTKDIK
jgi:hypothetical protein